MMEFMIYSTHGDEELGPFECLQYCDGKAKALLKCQIICTILLEVPKSFQ